jgi:flavodoxin
MVVYDSQFGNTERIAQAIASAVRDDGLAQAVRVDPVHPLKLQGFDLLVIGCPTQGWRPTPAIQSWLASLSIEQLYNVGVACFDTRFPKSRWLTGSAARVIGRTLSRRGTTLLVPPESFFVSGKEGPLVEGELERTASWARSLVSAVVALAPWRAEHRKALV